MIKETIENQDLKRRFILKVLKESTKGKYKNMCSGSKNCKNTTKYKYQYLKLWRSKKMINYKYYCDDCINLKNTELAI